MKTIQRLIIIGILVSAVILTGCTPKSDRVKSEYKDNTNSGSIEVLGDASYDWGDINIKGGDVKHTFTLKNTSDEPLYLKSIFTSCVCTKARFRLPDESISPSYGMSNNASYWAAEIKPNETFDVEVTFDPLYHGAQATGPISRSINIITSSKNDPVFELKAIGNVISKSEYNKKMKEEEPKKESQFTMGDFTFEDKEFDFGIIKQSGGLVKRDFSFTYNGETPLEITGTPASCACTSGEISRNKLSKGDQGILTVIFNPNLHEEPEGKFFKSVSILTEPKLEVIPEVKIWAEIDLDLGPEAYKLKEEHDDDDDHEDEIIEYNGKKIYLIEPEDLKEDLKSKDFFLLDVHIPEQTHIPGTDEFIDYRNISENIDKLPTNKDSKIIIYCRSGSMSRSAAQDLVNLGYTNVHDLEGGINAFNSL
ncbi:DUF1573 domain-containing protein [Candidatus Pacearchaeota archaeon]|nr:DUF1573 domain-containing protein [Candidatus Pacearchaeota archaeon]